MGVTIRSGCESARRPIVPIRDVRLARPFRSPLDVPLSAYATAACARERLVCPTVRAGDVSPVAYQVDAKLADALQELSPAAIQLRGWLGHRVALNEKNCLAQVDLEPLLAGYRQKPGTHPWIGEHLGKWMHAATLAWAYTGDESLRKKLDYAAEELIKSQEADGYLGTYTPDKRFGLYPEADWDVWSHKYCLMGLLTYYRFTGNTAALDACRKVGDLLIKTFGPGPERRASSTRGHTSGWRRPACWNQSCCCIDTRATNATWSSLGIWCRRGTNRLVRKSLPHCSRRNKSI